MRAITLPPDSHKRDRNLFSAQSSTIATTNTAAINTSLNTIEDESNNNIQQSTFKINLASIGLSFVADRPVRREFLSLHLEGLEPKIFQQTIHRLLPSSSSSNSTDNKDRRSVENASSLASDQSSNTTAAASMANKFDGTTTFFNFKLVDMQIDNYSETNVYPVLMHTLTEKARKKAAKKELQKQRLQKRQDRSRMRRGGSSGSLAGFMSTIKEESEQDMPDNNSSDSSSSSKVITANKSTNKQQQQDQQQSKPADDVSFILISLVRITPTGSQSSIYEYIAVRILEFKLALDSASLQLYILDLHNDLMPQSINQTLATETPVEWMEAYNNKTVIPEGKYMY